MPRVCSICTHDQRDEINIALVRNTPVRDIAGRYGTSKSTLERRKAEHMPAAIAKAHEAKEVAQASTLLDEVRALRSKAVGILLTAERAGDLRTALLAIREARSCVELLAEMEGELNRRPEVHVHLSAEWIEIRTDLLQTLAPYPDARGRRRCVGGACMIEPDIELNAAVARDVMRWTALGAHLWQDRQTSTVYYTGHDPTRVFMPHMVFNPSSDPLHVVWIEEQVGRLGKREAYLDTLIQEVGLDEHDVTMAYTTGYPAPAPAPVGQQVLLQATPVQRCRAALQVMRDAGSPSGAQGKV